MVDFKGSANSDLYLTDFRFHNKSGKFVITPTTKIEFLATMIDSTTRELSLLVEKVDSIINLCQDVLNAKSSIITNLSMITEKLNNKLSNSPSTNEL